jgi:hypothetical protein
MTLPDVFIDPPRSDLWGTPVGLKEAAEKLLWVTFSAFDPCPFPRPKDFDGLTIPWGQRGDAIFVNPPFTQTKQFIEKAVMEACNGRTVALLVAARTDTLAWHPLVFARAEAIYFIKGRLKFVDLSQTAKDLGLELEDKTSTYKSDNTAAFPSVLIVFRPTLPKICKALAWDYKS